jgi:hypothetical protein
LIISYKQYSDDQILKYHLDLHKQHLLHLCATWKSKVQSIPAPDMPDSWGPTTQEIQMRVLSDHQPRWGEPQEFDIQADISSDEELGNQETELQEAFEASALTEAYHLHDTDEFSLEHSFQNLLVETHSSEYIPSNVSGSSRKRIRSEDNM